jgi:molybdate transport system ATP-binding protein
VRRVVSDDARRDVLVEIVLQSGTVLSRVTSAAITRLAPTEGTPVLALIKSTSIELIAT